MASLRCVADEVVTPSGRGRTDAIHVPFGLREGSSRLPNDLREALSRVSGPDRAHQFEPSRVSGTGSRASSAGPNQILIHRGGPGQGYGTSKADDSLQEGTAEDAVGVTAAYETAEFRQRRIEILDRVAVEGGHLAPVGPLAERGEGSLEVGQQRGDLLRVLPPGEGDAEGVLALGRAQPMRVGRHRPQLRGVEVRPDAVPERRDRIQRLRTAGERNEVFALNLRPDRRSAADEEVRQPVTPSTDAA